MSRPPVQTKPITACSTSEMSVEDVLLVMCFWLFAVTSLVFEPYVAFGWPIDDPATSDPIAAIWNWYASEYDPIFLAPPLWLRVMCAIDMAVFGPAALLLCAALTNGWAWIRPVALVYGGAIVYSTIVYFAVELLQERFRGANMTAVVLINIPYTLVPLWLVKRMWRSAPFGKRARALPPSAGHVRLHVPAPGTTALNAQPGKPKKA